MHAESGSRETPQFIERSDGRRLFVFTHDPIVADRGTVIFCNPLFEEKLLGHRILVNLARELAVQRMRVIRFDYFGDGESDGDYAAADLLGRVSDILTVAEWERSRGGSPSALLGVRLGAALALAAAASARIVRVAMVDPIIEVESYLNEFLRRNLSWQMAVHRKIVADRAQMRACLKKGGQVNVEGYDLTEAYFAQGPALKERLLASISTVDLMACAVGSLLSQNVIEVLGKARACDFRSYREKPFHSPLRLIYPDYSELFVDLGRFLAAENQNGN
jgi:pimeloyl-ACP methyl ester carboxylesterase